VGQIIQLSSPTFCWVQQHFEPVKLGTNLRVKSNRRPMLTKVHEAGTGATHFFPFSTRKSIKFSGATTQHVFSWNEIKEFPRGLVSSDRHFSYPWRYLRNLAICLTATLRSFCLPENIFSHRSICDCTVLLKKKSLFIPRFFPFIFMSCAQSVVSLSPFSFQYISWQSSFRSFNQCARQNFRDASGFQSKENLHTSTLKVHYYANWPKRT
jgi:hypothetical protein